MKHISLLIFMVASGITTIAQCENFEMSITTNNPTCPGYSDGSISISQTGANGTVDGETTNSAGQIVFNGTMGTSPNNLTAGWYYIYLVDDLGCELHDSVYLEDPDEMEIILNVTMPSSISACDGIAEVDTVLHHIGSFDNLTFWWSGGPGGLFQTIKSDICYGNYSITVNNQVGCGVTKEFTVGNLSVEENQSADMYSLFPNPFSETTSFTIDQDYIGETLVIYNQLGQMVQMVMINSELTTITSENLNSGVYFFTISDIKGKLIVD